MDPNPHEQEPKVDLNIFDNLQRGQEQKTLKAVKNARTSLFVIAALQLVFGVAMAMREEEGIVRTVELGLAIFLAVLFASMGFLSKKKPYIALVIGLVVYGGLIVVNVMEDATSLYKGILIKVLIIGWLVKGVTEAKKLEDVRRVSNEE